MLPPHPDTRPGRATCTRPSSDGKRRRKAHVAVLVLEAHRGLRPGPGWEASHLYGIRTDNHLCRLAWETREQNLARIPLHAAERAVTDRPAGSVTGRRLPVTDPRSRGVRWHM